jgi:hypothetical protein
VTNDYKHPDGGRIYREGDPAHHFAELAAALRRECEDFIDHYDRRMAGRDYLGQSFTWPSDPDRIARSMSDTMQALDKAYTRIIVDRSMHEYGLGGKDDEWQRKYGDVG